MAFFGPPGVDKLKARRDVPRLIKALADPQRQAAAITALSEVGDGRAVNPLLEVVKTYRESAALRGAAMGALAAIGKRLADPALVRDIVHELMTYVVQGLSYASRNLGDQIMREESIKALLDLGDGAIPALVAALSRTSASRQEEAVEALARIGKPVFDRMLKELKNRELCEGAAQVLGRLQDPRAVEPLIDALRDPQCRNDAAEALSKIGDERAIGPLAEAVTAADTKDYINGFWQALEEFGARAEHAVIPILDHSAADRRYRAAIALRTIGTAHSIDPLTRALRDAVPKVATAAAEALDRLGWRPVEDSERATIAIAAGRWTDVVALGTSAVPALLRVLADDDDRPIEEMRLSILNTLASVGDHRAGQILYRHVVGDIIPQPGAHVTSAARNALVNVIKRDSIALPDDFLSAIAKLPDRTISEWPTRDNEDYYGVGQFQTTIELNELRSVASDALKKRGIDA